MDYADNTILLVDDEQPILRSMTRVLRSLKCKVYTSDSPAEALDVLKSNHIDIVISDMRMPEMSGEHFLEQVAKQWPDVERIVMTGYADPQAAIDAINLGKISRFMLKPWQDEDLLDVVRQGFEVSGLRRQNESLQALTAQKNTELASLNQSLEDQVQARTGQLKLANGRIKNSYRAVLRMFSTLTARRMDVKASADSHLLNQMLLGVAKRCGIEGKPLRQLYYAWQLRNIGKLSFNDDLLRKPYVELTADEQRKFHTHPLLSQSAMLLVAPLYPASNIILQHKEYLDGSGYPKGLKGDEIDLPARVLCVVNDYIELTRGVNQDREYSTHEALCYLNDFASERYQANVVSALEDVLSALVEEGEVVKDDCVSSLDLCSDFVLSRDLVSAQGILLLSSGQKLDDTVIERVREMEFNLDEVFDIYVQKA